LSAGQNAGLSNDVAGLDRAMEKAVAAFRGNYQEDDGFGGFGYTGPSTSSGLSGAGAYSMQLVGEARSKEVRNTLPMIAQRFPFDWENPNGRSPLYYWYYNTQAFFHEGGAAWDDWNKQFSSGLVKAQTVTGNGTSGYVDHNGHPQELGYWTSPTPREHNGGNGEVMDTILCTLMLEVYYRYLPILQATTTEDSKGDVKWKSESSAGGDGKPAPQHMKGAPTHSIIGYPTNISASDLDRVRGGWKKEKEWHGQPLNITGGAGHGSWVFKSETPMYLCLRHEKVEDGESTITDLWSEEAARDFTVMIHHRSEKVTQRLTESGFSFERFRDQASWMYSAGGKSVGLNGTWQPPPSATSPSTVYSLLGKRVPLDAGERVTLLSSSWEGIDKTFILSVLFSPDPPEKTGIVNSKEQRKDTSEHNNDLQVTK